VSEGLHEGSGALEAFVRRVVPTATEYVFRRIKDSRFRVHHGKDSGLFKRAVAWMLEARDDAFDAVVLVIDEDDDANRARELTKAQEDTKHAPGMPRAMGVAVRTFDAWMLADEVVLSQVLRCQVLRLPDPERERDPKRRCVDLRDQAAIDLSQRDMYADIARQVDLHVLATRCPSGFGTFLARLRSCAETLGEK